MVELGQILEQARPDNATLNGMCDTRKRITIASDPRVDGAVAELGSAGGLMIVD